MVCSCYVPPRGSEAESDRSNKNVTNKKGSLGISSKDHGIMEEDKAESIVLHCHNNTTTTSYDIDFEGPQLQQQNDQGKRKDGNGILEGPKCNIHPTPLKSNLKKTTTTTLVDANQVRTRVTRKVSWPDAHGKDIAHVQLFEPSAWDDGELGEIGNSCICVIQ